MRHRIAPAEYAAEVLGEWSDAAGALFPRELLDRQTSDLILPTFRELRPPARPVLGVDWGVSFDRSAVAAIYRLPVAELNAGEPRPVLVAVPHVFPVKTQLSEVVDAVVTGPGKWAAYIGTETNGVGAMPSQELYAKLSGDRVPRTWNPHATTSASKTAGYGTILGLLESERLVLPRDPELLRQLAGLRFEQGERGFTRIEAEDPAVHDDVADALMLAALPVRTRRGVACGLAQLADPARAPIDVHVGDLHTEVVETGGGLRVYRRSPLQSIYGGELTMPEGVAEAGDPRYKRLAAEGRAALQQLEQGETE
jgi:hypothetical protein